VPLDQGEELVLFDANGVAQAVANGVAIPAGTQGLLAAGSDGVNARFVLVDASGRPIISGAGVAGTPAGGVLSVQGVVGGTAVAVTSGTSATATVTSVSVTTSSVTLQAANAARLGLAIFNGSTNRTLYAKLGSGASLTDYTVQIPKLSYYEVPFGYTGIVTGRWNNSGSDAALMTEFT